MKYETFEKLYEFGQSFRNDRQKDRNDSLDLDIVKDWAQYDVQVNIEEINSDGSISIDIIGIDVDVMDDFFEAFEFYGIDAETIDDGDFYNECNDVANEIFDALIEELCDELDVEDYSKEQIYGVIQDGFDSDCYLNTKEAYDDRYGEFSEPEIVDEQETTTNVSVSEIIINGVTYIIKKK